MAFAVVFSMAFLTTAGAQESAEPSTPPPSQKVGYVDVEKIELGWIEYQELKKNLIRMVDTDEHEILVLDRELRIRKKELNKLRGDPEITDEGYIKRRNLIRLDEQELRIYKKIRGTIVSRIFDERLDLATVAVEKAIRKVGEEEQYDFILENEKLLGVDAKMDLSQKVINQLNKNDHNLYGARPEQE